MPKRYLTMNRLLLPAVLLILLSSLVLPLRLVATDHAPHAVPGQDRTAKTRLLEAGAELLQGEGPINRIHAHVCGFHFYNGEPARQVRAHHYCSHLNEEVMQCVIYDSHEPNARLIGVEYIISERVFLTLPDEEKTLWHSHRHEVMSGQLVAPGLPDVAEKELMRKLVNTYGKTWHFWQVDRGDALPLGTPKLMMSLTRDGAIDEGKLQTRDRELKVKSEEKREQRADLPARPVASGADAWEKGEVFQIPEPVSGAPHSK